MRWALFSVPAVLLACAGSAPPPTLPRLPTNPEPVGAVRVSPLSLRLVEGNKLIVPDDAEKAKLSELGANRAKGAFKVCIGIDGRPAIASMIASTGLPGYDQKILTRIPTFRYEPHVVDGKPTPACFALAFIYVQKNGRLRLPP